VTTHPGLGDGLGDGYSQRNAGWCTAFRRLGYRATADSTIKIFNDRIEFFNPGSLPDGVSLEAILAGQSPSMPRNKQIASMFKEAGIIEKYGSGIRRVREIMALAGVRSPEFEAMPYFFKVTLYPMATGSGVDMVEKNSGGVNEGVNEGVSEGVNEGVKSLLSAIRQQPGERAPFYAKKLGSPVKSVERWIKQLRDGQQIIYQGAPKTGGYYPVRGDSASKAPEA
jgi:ATP-dependent DNA helicase RecG